jgi:Tfp pilus assembly protein PilF
MNKTETSISPLLPRTLLVVGAALYLFIHFTTGKVEGVSDDLRQIEFTESMTSISECYGLESFGMFRPVKSVIFYAAVHWFDTVQAFQWIGAALCLFALLMTWLFLRRIIPSETWASVGALIWLYLPINVVIFNWGSALNIGFYYSFALGSILAIDRSFNDRSRIGRCLWVELGLLCYVMSLLSYEMAVSVPLLIALYMVVFRREQLDYRSSLFLAGAFVTITGLYLYIRAFAFAGATESIANPLIMPSESWQLSLASSVSYFEHLRLLFFPFAGYEMFIPFDPSGRLLEAIIGWVALGLLTSLALYKNRKFPLFFFGLLWSAFSLCAILNVIPVGAGPIAEYYMPLASVGIIVMIASLLAKCSKAGDDRILRLVVIMSSSALIFMLGLETYARQSVWRTEATLFSAIAENSDRSFVAHGKMATIQLENGDPKSALASIERAMEMTDDPQYVGLWITILMEHTSLPKYRVGQLIAASLAKYPESSSIYAVKGDFLMEEDLQGAESAYLRANSVATTKGSKLSALTSLGIVNIKQQEVDEAVKYFREAAELAPGDVSIRNNLEKALRDHGDQFEASKN